MIAHLEKNTELIPEEVMSSFHRRRDMWLNLFEQEEEANMRMEEIAKTDDDAQRIMTGPGVRAQTAVGMLVHIGQHRGQQFDVLLPHQTPNTVIVKAVAKRDRDLFSLL